MLEIPVSGYERVELFRGGEGEEPAVADAGPAHEGDGKRIMSDEVLAEANVETFIQQQLHAGGTPGGVSFCRAISSTATTCSRLTVGNPCRKSSSPRPRSSASKRFLMGTRVP